MAKKAASKEGVAIRPLADRVLVKPLKESESKSPSGIILPESGEERKDRGVVMVVGEGRRGDNNELIPVGVKVGETVIFQWGEKVEYDGEEYYLVSESNVLAVIEK